MRKESNIPKELTQEEIHKLIAEHEKHCEDCQSKSSKEFKEKMQWSAKDEELAAKKHEMTMKELEYRRESDRLHHERELERGRIFRAEERKTIMLKAQEYRDRGGKGNPKYPQGEYSRG